MTTEATNHRERISKILLIIGAIPAGFLGAGLTLGGCCWGGWWLVVLFQGKSAAELPDPIAMLYPILMIAAGIIMLSIMGVFLAINRRLRRAQ